MIPEERRTKILNKIEEKEIYTIDNLTSELNVSRVTIQRDVNLLAKEGLLYKVHGGVRLNKKRGAFIETRFDARLKRNYNEKLEIAKKALKFVNDYSTIFIDSSTTGYIFAKELFKERFADLNIVTISPAILYEALKFPQVKIISTGGILEQNTNMLYGEMVIDFLNKINIDAAFISAAGVSVGGGATSSNTELIKILRTIFNRVREINLLVDKNKLNKVAMMSISEINRCKRIITDSNASEKDLSEFSIKTDIELVY